MNQNSFSISITPIFKTQKYFVFNDKKYQFDFELIKNNSNYFFIYQEQYKQIEFIDLFQEDEREIYKDITDTAIKNFISLIQNQQYTINENDLFHIKYLAEKYEFTNLVNTISDLISKNKKKLFFLIYFIQI